MHHTGLTLVSSWVSFLSFAFSPFSSYAGSCDLTCDHHRQLLVFTTRRSSIFLKIMLLLSLDEHFKRLKHNYCALRTRYLNTASIFIFKRLFNRCILIHTLHSEYIVKIMQLLPLLTITLVPQNTI